MLSIAPELTGAYASRWRLLIGFAIEAYLVAFCMQRASDRIHRRMVRHRDVGRQMGYASASICDQA
jgi:hypothetical protein